MRKITSIVIKFVFTAFAFAFLFLEPASAHIKLLESQAQTTLFLPLVVKNYSSVEGYGDVTGYVHDARSGLPLEGIIVCLEGTSTCAPSSDSSGKYTIQDIPNGTAEFIAYDPENQYSQAIEIVTVVTNISVELNFNLFPVLLENQFRVVLTWDENSSWPCAPYICPNDMNLHMWWTSDNVIYERYDIDHRGNCDDLEVDPNVCYENDEQYGTGPDTIAFKFREAGSQGIYYFAVLNYYADWPNVPNFFERTPRARVQVFDSNQVTPVYDFVIDPSTTIGTGDLWYVFQLEYSKPIPQNCISLFDQVGDTPPDDCYPELEKNLR